MSAIQNNIQSSQFKVQYQLESDCEKTLFRRPQPIQGESWRGYLLRIAASNHFRSVAIVASVCGFKTMNQLLREDPRVVLRKLGVSVCDTSEWAPFIPFRNAPVKRGNVTEHISSWKSRVCPLCLRSDTDRAFIRSHWDWAMQVCCPTHNVRLLEQCEICKTPIDLRRHQVSHCNCGADFRQQKAQISDEVEETIARLLPEIDLKRLGRTFELEPYIHRAAARVCKWLSLMPNPDGRRPKRKSLRAIKLSERELENLQELVADWPVALANSLSKEVDLNSGSSYTALGVKLNRRQFRLFEIITAEIRKIYPTQYAVIESQSESKYLFSQSHSSKLDVLVALTGSSRKFLIRQIIKGAIAPGLLKSGDLLDKDRLEIDAYSSEHISKLYRETYDCQTAASRAGCSVGAMQGLLAMKLLPSTSIFIEPVPMKSRRIYPEDLQNFVFELFSRACCLDEIPPTHIKFSDWVTKHSHGRNSRHLRWRDLFDALRNGKLELHKSSDAHTLLDQLFIDAEAVAIICDKRRGSRKCSS